MTKQTSDNEMRRRLAYAVKNQLHERTSSALRKVVLFTLMFASTSLYGESLPSDKTAEPPKTITNAPKDTQKNLTSLTSSLNLDIDNMQLLDAATACDLCTNSEAQFDFSHITFSMDDFKQVSGQETPESKRMLKIAEICRAAKGHCTQHFKNVMRKLGWVSPEDKAFNSIVPAWQLNDYLAAGNIKNLVEIPIATQDQKCKTTPIPMIRVNEKGCTKYAHVQFMGPQGACYGNKWETSPDGHRGTNGRLQAYGQAHFYTEKRIFTKFLSCMIERGKITCYQDNQGVIHVMDTKTPTNANTLNWSSLTINKPNFEAQNPNRGNSTPIPLTAKFSSSATRNI
jgi:hypothetical protein